LLWFYSSTRGNNTIIGQKQQIKEKIENSIYSQQSFLKNLRSLRKNCLITLIIGIIFLSLMHSEMFSPGLPGKLPLPSGAYCHTT